MSGTEDDANEQRGPGTAGPGTGRGLYYAEGGPPKPYDPTLQLRDFAPEGGAELNQDALRAHADAYRREPFEKARVPSRERLPHGKPGAPGIRGATPLPATAVRPPPWNASGGHRMRAASWRLQIHSSLFLLPAGRPHHFVISLPIDFASNLLLISPKISIYGGRISLADQASLSLSE